MIEGEVNADRFPLISLVVFANDGSTHKLSLKIDTGFTGWITLPPELIDRMDLPSAGFRRVTLADGSDLELPGFYVEVVWLDVIRTVVCLATTNTYLAGMSMMYGCSLRMDIVDGGRTTIRQRIQ